MNLFHHRDFVIVIPNKKNGVLSLKQISFNKKALVLKYNKTFLVTCIGFHHRFEKHLNIK